MSAVLGRFVLPAVIAGGSVFAAEKIGFEGDEGFVAEADIATQSGWKKSTPAIGTISAEQAATGTQSLRIALSADGGFVSRAFAIPEKDVIFIDFDILPCADPSESPAATVDANGVLLGFLKEKDHGRIYIVSSSEKAPATDTGFDFATGEDNGAQKWLRVTIRQDLKAKTWDLFLDGKLTLIDRPFSGSFSRTGTFSVYGSLAGDAYLDDVTIGSVNPLFSDADADGIPDADEILAGTNAWFDDRQADLDLDGTTNLEEYVTTGRILGKNGRNSRKVIFVDALRGNDRFSGEISYATGGIKADGPKATLAAAIDTADAETAIALLPSLEAYTLIERAPGTKFTTNLIPLGDISLKTPDHQ